MEDIIMPLSLNISFMAQLFYYFGNNKSLLCHKII
jgi:hypothetical protein